MTCRPTPTVAALGRVVSGGTTTSRSRVALDEAGQPPAGVELVRGEGARVVPGDRRSAGETRTLHLWQVPWPPQVESMAMPFHDAESKTVTPGGTRTARSVGGAVLVLRP